VNPKYHEGKKAREDFERVMTALFQVRKSEMKGKPRPERKERPASKD
jgi:hypothetical protein